MKSLLFLLFLVGFICLYPIETNALSMPCSMVLEPEDKNLKNSMGSVLVYKVQLNPPSFPRTNVSILALHLPDPKSYGNYDRFEGFAFIQDEISWRFPLYPSPEVDPTWAGRFDLITADMNDVTVQVRLSTSKSDKLAPSILTNHVRNCK